MQEEGQWRAGRALMTVCNCNHCVCPRDISPCFLHTRVREYVHALDVCCTDDRYNAEAMREVRRLHSVAREREGSILNGNIVWWMLMTSCSHTARFDCAREYARAHILCESR